MRARIGPVQTSILRACLVGRAHTLENVGRNEWLYSKQTELYKSLLTPMFCNLRYSFEVLTEELMKLQVCRI